MRKSLPLPLSGVLTLILSLGVIPASGDPVSDAMANAKSGLLLAIEELQASTGPDQRVTARADILGGNIARPHLTGVWNSWEISATNPPSPSDYESPAKTARFRGWLVSHPDPSAAHQISFASQQTIDPATLWGAGSLGPSSSADFVTASKVPVASPAGAYAWAVLDEGVKVRINTPFADNATTVAAKTQQLGSGERPGTEFIPGLQGLNRSYFETGSPEFANFISGIGNEKFGPTAESLAPGTSAALKPLTHDVSLHSMGLFTDTARGGLRQDFHLMTNGASLPPPYNGLSVYNSLFGLTSSNAPSDPKWEAFRQFATIYRDSNKLRVSNGTPVLQQQAPTGWSAATTTGNNTILNPSPPPGQVLLPTIAKVEILFSLVGRDLYANLPPAPITRPLTPSEKSIGNQGPLDGFFRNTKYDYDLHLLYSPIITLHNPYNVTIQFSSVKVNFQNVPFAMQVFRNGIPQSTGLVPLDTMYQDNATGQNSKTFGMELKASLIGSSSTFRMAPGEVRMFSTYLDPDLNWTSSYRSPYWDLHLYSSKTNYIWATPGWRGDGIGFDTGWLAGGQAVDGLAANGHWNSTLALAWDDQIHVEFAPLSIPLSNNKFVVRMTANVGTGSSVVSAIEMDYETPTGLQDSLLGANGRLRYPKADATPNFVYGWNLVDRATTPISALTNVKPFALLSLRAKTTSGGVYPDHSEGRSAAKPWSFAHASIGASSQKVLSGHPANHSHEIDLQALDIGTTNFPSVDSQARSFFISGINSFHGARFGALYDIPLSPLQSLASLNGANPGGSSGYLPRFAQPIGNSWAHPLIPPANLSVSGSDYPYLDHSFLLNLALYDRFFFSGLAQQTGAFGSGRSTTDIAADFAGGAPLDDPRLLLYRPAGGTASGFSVAVADPDAYAKIAAWQMMKGAFNINSTSVPAWKAMLASLHDAQAVFNQIDKTSIVGVTSITDLGTSTGKARISRFRLPASKSAAQGGDSMDAYWLGPREYSDAELQTLAENIVQQIRLRGPFLSMAEFVNRRLGTGDLAQRGALQQAIDDSNLNQTLASTANAGYEIQPSTVSGYGYPNPDAATGPSYQGAPGYLTQADLLNVLGNAATARSDTFTIRSYGEARDGSGQSTASAICEAVVQRLPDWVDPADSAETSPANLLSPENQTKGRRFRVISFRWLAPGEI